MIKYIKTTNSGKGFITHSDQEQDGLFFECLPGNITKITGSESFILLWKDRVSGIEIEANTAIAEIENKIKEYKIKKIQELKDELLILENDVK